tara:strand:- start:2520 stop:3230 length:711 start_codon:yes stop_codon:yes gene_type:complete
MALPKLNDVPYYSITIPSTGMKTRFRPYFVREEKVLLIALETGDIQQISAATVDMISACIKDDIDNNMLTIFDIEYLFLKIRSKSVGEKIELNFNCTACEEENVVVINIDDIEVSNIDPKDKLIKLTDQVEVEMRYIPYIEATENINTEATSYAEIVFNNVLSSMYSVNTDEERLLISDETAEDVSTFVESLTTGQFNELRNFVENSPTVFADASFMCECGTHNEIPLRGMDDFFE